MNKVSIFVLLTAFCFGTLEISGKFAVGNLDAFQITFWRFLIGAACLLPIAVQEYKELRPTPTKGNVLYIIAAGIICVPISLLLCQLGIERCNASTASVILGTNGMFTMIFAHFMANEKFTSYKAKLLLLALVGLVFLICPWDMQEGNTLLGAVLMLIGAITFGLYVVMGKIVGRKVGSITQACGSMFAGAMALLVIILATNRPVFDGIVDNIWVVLYAGVVVTGGGYFFLFMAVKHSDASTASVAFFLKIVIAPILSVIILREELVWNAVVGILFVLASSFLNLRSNRTQPPKLADTNC